MNNAVHRITMDLTHKRYSQVVNTQRLSNGDVLEIALRVRSLPYQLDENASVILTVNKADGTKVVMLGGAELEDYTQEDDDPVVGQLVVDDDKIGIPIIPQMLAAPGTAVCQLVVIGPGEDIRYSPCFELFVWDNTSVSGVTSADEWSALTTAIREANDARDEAEDAAEEAEDAAGRALEAEARADAAAGRAITAEGLALAAESAANAAAGAANTAAGAANTAKDAANTAAGAANTAAGAANTAAGAANTAAGAANTAAQRAEDAAEVVEGLIEDGTLGSFWHGSASEFDAIASSASPDTGKFYLVVPEASPTPEPEPEPEPEPTPDPGPVEPTEIDFSDFVTYNYFEVSPTSAQIELEDGVITADLAFGDVRTEEARYVYPNCPLLFVASAYAQNPASSTDCGTLVVDGRNEPIYINGNVIYYGGTVYYDGVFNYHAYISYNLAGGGTS